MLIGFLIIVGVMGLLMLLERIFPDRPLVQVKDWWTRVLAINAFQLAAVILSLYTWELWFLSYPHSIFELSARGITPAMGGMIAYLCNTWLFYWWHYARHEVHVLWLLCHQVHHSPQRIETITSFYKHPMEIVADSILMAALLYPVLGLTKESSVWLSGFSAIGEFLYHMNIRTPRWFGYVFQRPESHRVHHLRNQRINCKNYSDIPLWDILNGTFENPRRGEEQGTGFDTDKELALKDMLLFRDVVRKNYKTSPFRQLFFNRNNIYAALLLLLGCTQSLGHFLNMPGVRQIGFATAASPLPLVFTQYKGVETFSTQFDIVLSAQTAEFQFALTHREYALLHGAYNRRNAYGVLFSHGLLFTQPLMIQLHREALHYGFCSPGTLLQDFTSIIPDEFIQPHSITIYMNSNTNNYNRNIQLIC